MLAICFPFQPGNEVTYVIAFDIDLWQSQKLVSFLSPELASAIMTYNLARARAFMRLSMRQHRSTRRMAYRTRLNHLFQRQIHPCITRNKMSIEGFSILELYEHRVALRRIEEAEWKLSNTKSENIHRLSFRI